MLPPFCETGTRRRCVLSRSGIFDARPATLDECGGDNDGSDVDAGCGSWADRDVRVADGADATGDAALPADVDVGRAFGDFFRLAQRT